MKLLHGAVSLLFLLFIPSCVTLNNNDEVSWDVNYSLPLLKERLSVSMLGLQSLNISDDSTRLGDTLFLQRIDSLQQNYQSTLFSLPKNQNYQYDGSLMLSRLNTIKSLIPFSNLNELPSLSKITANNPISKSNISRDTMYLGPINTLTFGDYSDSLSAIVKNNSDSTTAYDVNYRIFSGGDTITYTTIDSLKPGDSVIVKASISNKSIGSTIIVESDAHLASSLTSEILKNISFSTDLNGLPFLSGIISDSAFTLDFSHTVSIPFGQKGFNIGHIDISKLYFPFTLINSLPIEYKLDITIDNIWAEEYCSQNELKKYLDLASIKLDSQYFEGSTFKDFIITSGNDTNNELNHTLSFKNARVLPLWNTTDTINTIRITIAGTMKASGQLVTIDNQSKTQLSLNAPEIEINAIYGAYSDISRVPNKPIKIPLLSKSSDFDLIRQLRNKLIPSNTAITMNTNFQLSDSTLFESIKIAGVIFETDTSTPIDTFLIEMNNISAEKEFTYSYNLANILRQLPDSIGYYLTYIIEPGKTIFLDHKTLVHDNGVVQAKFGIDVTLDMKALLVWGISDTIDITFDRTIGSFPISSQTINLMENKDLTLSIKLLNNSNIIGRLRAISGIETDQKTNLLGENGIFFSKRGTTVDNIFSFSQNEIQNIISSDSLDIHWIFDLFPSNVDALRDTDYVEINAELTLKGEHSTKSLFWP